MEFPRSQFASSWAEITRKSGSIQLAQFTSRVQGSPAKLLAYCVLPTRVGPSRTNHGTQTAVETVLPRPRAARLVASWPEAQSEHHVWLIGLAAAETFA